MNLKTIYSPSPAQGWLPWALLTPILCIAFAIATEIPSSLLLERFGFQDAHGDFIGAQGLVAMLFVSFITWMIAVAAWIAFVERRHAGTIGLTKAGAATGFSGGLVVGVLMPAAVVAGIWAAGAYDPGALFPAAASPAALVAVAALFAGFLVQASIEEIIFRGWLISVVTRRTNLIFAVVLSSLVFTLMHFSRDQPWLVTGNTLLFALFASAWAISSNNIWGVMGWHVGWNWMIATGFDVPVTGLDAGVPALIVSLTPAGTDFLTGGADGPEGSVLCTLVLVCGILVFVRRIARNRRDVGPDGDEAGGPRI